MYSAMNSTVAETFEYRHKKFDQFKHFRNDSTSSADEYECIKVEIERLEESTFPQTSSVTSYTTTNWSSSETYASLPAAAKRLRTCTANENTYSATEGTSLNHVPAAKRMRTTSSSESTYSALFSPSNITTTLRHTSTPFVAATTTPWVNAIAPSTAVLPNINDETLRSICKYHGNMVRKFPKKERTPKDQERRNKNTIACRMSRRVKKLEHVAIEEQYKKFSQQTFNIIEQSMRATAYLHELMKLSAVANGNEGEIPSLEAHTMVADEKFLALAGQKKPFTIAFLTGNEE